jgi:hypothetical protein
MRAAGGAYFARPLMEVLGHLLCPPLTLFANRTFEYTVDKIGGQAIFCAGILEFVITVKTRV